MSEETLKLIRQELNGMVAITPQEYLQMIDDIKYLYEIARYSFEYHVSSITSNKIEEIAKRHNIGVDK